MHFAQTFTLLTILMLLVGCDFSQPFEAKLVPGGVGVSTESWSGIKTYGGAGGYADSQGLARDSQGNLLLLLGSDVGVEGRTVIGTWDTFVVKISPAGVVIDVFQFGFAASEIAPYGFTVDASDNIYITGTTNANGYGGETRSGTWDAFVLKASSTGTLLWYQQEGLAGGTSSGAAVAVLAGGDVVMTGKSNVTFNGAALMGSTDLIGARLDKDTGAFVWSRSYGVATYSAEGRDVVVDSFDDVYLLGFSYGGINGEVASNTWNADATLIKLSNVGGLLWTRLYGDPSSNFKQTTAMTIDLMTNGNLVFAGTTNVADFLGDTQIGSRDGFRVVVSAAGGLVDSALFGAVGASLDEVHIVVDPNGGYYQFGVTNVGLNGATQMGDNDHFVTRLDSSFSHVWTQQIGSPFAGMYYAHAVVDEDSNVITGASFYDSIGGIPLIGWGDAFLMKRDVTGVAY